MSWDDEDAEWDASSDDDLANKFVGEDEDVVAENWDDEDAPQKKEVKPKVAPSKKKGGTKALMRRLKEKEAQKAALRLQRRQEAMRSLDPVEEKRRAAIAQEKSNQKQISDLFGGMDDLSITKKEDDLGDMADGDNQDMFADGGDLYVEKEKKIEEGDILDRDDVNEFVDKVAKKITSTKFLRKENIYFLKTLITKLTDPMKLDDANQIKKHLNVICNKKAKDPSKAKKKKGKSLGRDNNPYADYSRDTLYDDFW